MMLDFSGVRLPKKVLVLWRLNSLLASTILVILAVCAGFFWWPGEIFTAVTLFFSAVVVGNLVLDVFVLARFAIGLIAMRTHAIFCELEPDICSRNKLSYQWVRSCMLTFSRAHCRDD